MRSSFLLRLLPLLLLCSLTLTACASSARRDPFAYARASFSLSVEGSYLPANDPGGIPRPFAAEITAGEPREGNPSLRDLTVVFTAPASLAGVTITATLSPTPDGGLARRVDFTHASAYGRIQTAATGIPTEGFLRFAEGFLPLGDVVEVSPETADGGYTVTRRDGNRELVFTFAAGSLLPTALKLTDERGTVDMHTK